MPTDLCDPTLGSLWSELKLKLASEFTSPNNPHPPSIEYCVDFSSDTLSGDASFLPIAHQIPVHNVAEILPFDHIIIHWSDVPLATISPSDFFQTFNTPPTVDLLSPVTLSPCESRIAGGDGSGSGTSYAPSPSSPSPVTSRGSSASPKRTSAKDKGSPRSRSKSSVAIKGEGATAKQVEVPPTDRAFPRRASRQPATYVYNALQCTSSPPMSDPEPDTDEEWKPDDSVSSDHEDDISMSSVDYEYSDHKATRFHRNRASSLSALPPNAAISVSGRTERQRIRSFAQQRRLITGSSSAEWVLHKGQYICKAIVRQESKRGRAKWLPGSDPEVGHPCNQLFGTYQDWERHFSCSQWHQEPDTCRFCGKNLNVRSVERHLGKSTTHIYFCTTVCLISFRSGSCKHFKHEFMPELCKLYPTRRSGVSWSHIKSTHLTQVVRQEQAKAERGERNAWTSVISRFT